MEATDSKTVVWFPGERFIYGMKKIDELVGERREHAVSGGLRKKEIDNDHMCEYITKRFIHQGENSIQGDENRIRWIYNWLYFGKSIKNETDEEYLAVIDYGEKALDVLMNMSRNVLFMTREASEEMVLKKEIAVWRISESIPFTLVVSSQDLLGVVRHNTVSLLNLYGNGGFHYSDFTDMIDTSIKSLDKKYLCGHVWK